MSTDTGIGMWCVALISLSLLYKVSSFLTNETGYTNTTVVDLTINKAKSSSTSFGLPSRKDALSLAISAREIAFSVILTYD
ncbi:hypothetical protein F4680DRAFT_415206 [Xylaria scruposa]|nr:hypothetical protein F4680DRAFT_415206 [Xylaria scruposa]